MEAYRQPSIRSCGTLVQPVADVIQAPPGPITRFPFVLPEGQAFTRTGRPMVAVSPDGTQVVYVANEQVYLRNLDEMEARPIPGTDEDPSGPFFSPDGDSIGFY